MTTNTPPDMSPDMGFGELASEHRNEHRSESSEPLNIPKGPDSIDPMIHQSDSSQEDPVPTSRRRRPVNRPNYADTPNVLELDPESDDNESESVEETLQPQKQVRRKRGRPPLHNKRVPETSRTPWNWQRKPHASDKMGKLNYDGATVSEDRLTLTMADGSTLTSGDFVYLLVEPLGEPYYVGRIMEFETIENPQKPDCTNAADRWKVKCNWLLRPANVDKQARDTRELVLTMQSDDCELESIRGKCIVKHKNDIENPQTYKDTPSNFWFDRLWDRHIKRFFEVVPSYQLAYLPDKVRLELEKRVDFVVAEPVKAKEMRSKCRCCKTCSNWCTEKDSVNCAFCKSQYHMACLNPPIAEKPTGRYGWACGPCCVDAEKDARAGMLYSAPPRRRSSAFGEETDSSPGPAPVEEVIAPEPACNRLEKALNLAGSSVPREKMLWPFTYLGTYAGIEDVFDVDGSIEPRAASRIGPKYQTKVTDWPGRPVEYYKVTRPDRRASRGRPKRGAPPPPPVPLIYEPANLDRSLPWVQEVPSGYIERGGDSTSTLNWTNTVGDPSEFLQKTHVYAQKLGMKPYSTNFMDACLKAFLDAAGQEAPALRKVATFTRKSLKEPTFTSKEEALFDVAVSKYGSDLHSVYKEVGSKSSADIVRHYYMWKKTSHGAAIWDVCAVRPSRRRAPPYDAKFLASIADTFDPETTLNSDKLKKQHKNVICVHCGATASREWKRCSGTPPGPEDDPIEALCSRCSRLWYRYGVVWDKPESVLRVYATRYGKFKTDPELLEDARAILAERTKDIERPRKKRQTKQAEVDTDAAEVEGEAEGDNDAETDAEAGSVAHATPTAAVAEKEVKVEPKVEAKPEAKSEAVAATPEPIDIKDEGKKEDEKRTVLSPHTPENNEIEVVELLSSSESSLNEESFSEVETDMEETPDKASVTFCAVCLILDPTMPQLKCSRCQLAVHSACYGESLPANGQAWQCDTCRNDVELKYSAQYKCTLCPVPQLDFANWVQTGMPYPPDALKHADLGSWAHVRCAVWTPAALFGDAAKLAPVTGLAAIKDAANEKCFLCSGPVASPCKCDRCDRIVHAGCAGFASYSMGFAWSTDPVGRLIEFQGRSGRLEARIRCPEHSPDGLIAMSELDAQQNKTALQLYAQQSKQAPTSSLQPGAEFFVNQKDPSKVVSVIYSANPDQKLAEPPVEPPVCGSCGNDAARAWFKTSDGVLKCPGCHGNRQEHQAQPVPTFDEIESGMVLDMISAQVSQQDSTRRASFHLNTRPTEVIDLV